MFFIYISLIRSIATKLHFACWQWNQHLCIFLLFYYFSFIRVLVFKFVSYLQVVHSLCKLCIRSQTDVNSVKPAHEKSDDLLGNSTIGINRRHCTCSESDERKQEEKYGKLSALYEINRVVWLKSIRGVQLVEMDFWKSSKWQTVEVWSRVEFESILFESITQALPNVWNNLCSQVTN